jgi:hypothetical protein
MGLTYLRMVLRDFLYIDRGKVQNFLAQLEEGLAEEKKITDSTTGTFGGKAGLNLPPVQLGFNKAKDKTYAEEYVVRQVAASEFNRLYDYISVREDENFVVLENVADASGIGTIKRQWFTEAVVTIRISEGPKLLKSFATTMRSELTAGSAEEGEVDVVDLMFGLASSEQSESEFLPVIATVPGDANLKVGLDLRRSGLLVSTIEIDAVIMFQVQRVLQDGQRHVVGDPVDTLPDSVPLQVNKGFRSMINDLSEEDLDELGITNFIIEPPAFVGSPIAIWT